MLKAIDFFCGGGGMTHGLLKAGINVVAGIDVDEACKATYQINNKPARFITADISSLSPAELKARLLDGTDNQNGIDIRLNDDEMVFVGCSPCQFWSLINTEKKNSETSKNLLIDFQNFVDYFNPGYVVIENVPGLSTRSGSPLPNFVNFLSQKGFYSIAQEVLKVSDFGVPQTRRRFVLIASRVKVIALPQKIVDTKLTVRNFIGDSDLFPPIVAGTKDLTDFCHTSASLSEVNLKRIDRTRHNGGNRSDWKDTELQLNVYKENDHKKDFVFTDVYGRMSWDKLSPTITTRFMSLSNGRFGHPEQNRAISLREGATLQTFPPNYSFVANSNAVRTRIIGNAVPPELARRIGESLMS